MSYRGHWLVVVRKLAHPLQAILDAPVPADGVTKMLGIGAELALRPCPGLATALDHNDAREAWPLVTLLEPADVAVRRDDPGLDPPVALLDRLMLIDDAIPVSAGFLLGEEELDVLA